MLAVGFIPRTIPPVTLVASRRLKRGERAGSNRHEPSVHDGVGADVHDNDGSASSVADAAGI
jgi:hypothetical protein